MKINSSFPSHRRLPLSHETLQRSHQEKPQRCQTLQQQSCLLHKAAGVSTCPEGTVCPQCLSCSRRRIFQLFSQSSKRLVPPWAPCVLDALSASCFWRSTQCLEFETFCRIFATKKPKQKTHHTALFCVH